MATFSLIRLGNPILRQKSLPVSKSRIHSIAFQKFLDKLAKTCLKEKGAGIAAVQVGKNIRVIVVHVDPNNPRYPGRKFFPLTIVINPKVIERSEETKEDWEGDLSVDLRGLVPRSITCVVTGLDRDGKEVTFNLKNDFHARVFQHEIDHLDGIMFLDKVRKKDSFCTYAMWKKYWKDKSI